MTVNRFEIPVLERLSWWAEEAMSALGERNNVIREAAADGYPLRTIAKAAGLSHTAIAKILKRG